MILSILWLSIDVLIMEMDMDMMNQWLPDMKRVVEGIGTGLALAADAVCEKNLFNTPALIAMAVTLFPRWRRSVKWKP